MRILDGELRVASARVLRFRQLQLTLLMFVGLGLAGPALASPAVSPAMTQGPGLMAVALFVLAYLLVITEELTGLRKSKPVLLAAGLIWILVALALRQSGSGEAAGAAARESLRDYAELLLFLLVAMTYVNALSERQVFAALGGWLANRRFGLRQLFWVTGFLAFFLSAVLDNLTTALVMGGIVLGISSDRRFLTLSCINIVVAANAGGAWSAFGDITTLMVWQAGHLQFFEFLRLLGPSLVAYLVPAIFLHLALPDRLSLQPTGQGAVLRPGGIGTIVLFALTLVTAVSFQNLLALPPVFGMMLGLGYLKMYSYYRHLRDANGTGRHTPFDVFSYIARVEWDTLLFFYGVILCVGGLATLGYMELLAGISYERLGPTTANILVGIASAVIDNIPIMAAVLEMNPTMPDGQWLLLTLTAGIGGSLLSVGSAAGVALMGQAREHYTFSAHLWWTPAIALGYAAAIWVHLLVNRSLF